MAFKGKYSHLITNGCDRSHLDLSEIDREYHLERGNIYSRLYGWIKSDEIILRLSPSSEIEIESLIGKQEGCSQIIKRGRSPIFKDLFNILKPMVPRTKLRFRDIESIKVCPNNPWIVLVKFSRDTEATGEFTQKFVNEDGNGTGGGLPKNRNESLPNGSYGPNLDISVYDENDLLDLPGQTRTKKPKQFSRVGIVDRGPFSNSAPFFHVDIIKRIIEDGPYVGVVNMPMVENAVDEATTFDMICALNNKEWLDQVDVINISQGHYAPTIHPLLYETIRCINRVIVCSAGNEELDNDSNGHWPSNLSSFLDHVIAVANIDANGNFHVKSNYGRKSVTISGIGEFGSKVTGTSYSAGWVSRMIALAYSVSGYRDLTLSEIINVIREIYPTIFNTSDITLSKIRFLR